MSKFETQIEFEKVCWFGLEMAGIRAEFPEFAREIDKCMFDVGRKHIGCCGDAKCDCQMSFDEFHQGQNIKFGTTNEVQNYEFN